MRLLEDLSLESNAQVLRRPRTVRDAAKVVSSLCLHHVIFVVPTLIFALFVGQPSIEVIGWILTSFGVESVWFWAVATFSVSLSLLFLTGVTIRAHDDLTRVTRELSAKEKDHGVDSNAIWARGRREAASRLLDAFTGLDFQGRYEVLTKGDWRNNKVEVEGLPLYVVMSSTGFRTSRPSDFRSWSSSVGYPHDVETIEALRELIGAPDLARPRRAWRVPVILTFWFGLGAWIVGWGVMLTVVWAWAQGLGDRSHDAMLGVLALGFGFSSTLIFGGMFYLPYWRPLWRSPVKVVEERRAEYHGVELEDDLVWERYAESLGEAS